MKILAKLSLNYHQIHTLSLLYFSRVEITKKGESYKMILKNLAETDAGEYMCKVGDRPTKCQVIVEECMLSTCTIILESLKCLI